MLSSRSIQLNADGGYISTKTPGRGLKNRVENAHAGGGVAMTINGKGKNASAFPKTPFQPSSVQPKGGKQRVLLTTTRPLGDKTPLPNRFGGNVLFQTPLPGMSKLSKLNQGRGGGGEGGTPDSLQRPSSMRKHIKQPRNSGGKTFETPVNNGNPWDVSDGGIVIPEALPETILEDEGDDMDEVEYGPPNTLDLPYEPPFDFALPDYKEVGKTLFQLAHSCHYDDAPLLPEPDFKVTELEDAKWDMLSLPPIESDDPFHLARLESLTLPSTVKAGISRPRPLMRVTKTPGSKPVIQSATKSIPRTAIPRPTSRVAPPASSSRSTSAASTKPALPNLKPNVNPVTATLKRLPSTSTRSIASSTTAYPGVKPASSSIVPRKTVEPRRPHTALALGTAAKANPKVVPYVDEVIVLNDVGLGIDLDFKFDV